MTASAMSEPKDHRARAPGRPRSRGYAGASIDAIVERAGGSKATVYALFGNKEGLLTALVSQGAERHSSTRSPPAPRWRKACTRSAAAISISSCSPSASRSTDSSPARAGAARIWAISSIAQARKPSPPASQSFFRAAAARGQLEAADPEQLAHFFVHALRGDHHNRVLFNPTRMPTPQEIERHIDFVVRTFLRCCQPTAGKLRSL